MVTIEDAIKKSKNMQNYPDSLQNP